MAISETTVPSKERNLRGGVADNKGRRPVGDVAFFNEWKRFCFVLREIASGEDGRPPSGLDAQKRAQAVLVECGHAHGRDARSNYNARPLA